MTTRPSASFLKIVAIAIIMIGVQSLYAVDFSKYTTIPGTLKNALRANWQGKFPSSGYTSGNVAVYGNSITYTNAFWRPFAWGSPGIVPGTNLASYTVEKGTGTCAYSGYQIGDGLSCVEGANASLKPEVVICEYGTNDIRDKSIGSFGSDYGRYLDVLLDKGSIPIISTIPPMRMNGDASFEAVCIAINDTIRAVAQRKNVVLVDYWKAMMDCSANNPFSGSWMDADGVHPAGGCTLTDTANPQCGYGVRNAVCWHAVNKVYRIIIENGTADDGGRDSVSPSPVTNLSATTGPYSGCVTLSWNAPGNDGTKGTAVSYDLRRSETAITAANFAAATAITTAPRPLPAGSLQTCVANGLVPGRNYFFAIVASDGPNRSALSNVVSARADSGTSYFSDSATLTSTSDTYLESGSDAGSSWGDKPYIRIKSGGQGIPLVKFPVSSLSFTPDSGVLFLTVVPDMADNSDYTYRVDVCGVTVDWDGTTASFNKQRTGVAWQGGNPQANFDRSASSSLSVSFTGTKSGKSVHAFPLSAAVARGLANGTYTSIALYETGSSYNNCHFSSSEGSVQPRLLLYKKSGATTNVISQPKLKSSAIVQITTGGQRSLLFDVSGFGSTRGWIGRVYTCNGKKYDILAARQTENSDIAGFQWDTRTSAPGTYLVHFTNNRESAIRKVTVR